MKQVSIRKNDTADIRVTRDIYKGRETVDIRVWFFAKTEGVFVPSSKGVTFDAGKCPELIQALQTISE